MLASPRHLSVAASVMMTSALCRPAAAGAPPGPPPEAGHARGYAPASPGYAPRAPRYAPDVSWAPGRDGAPAAERGPARGGTVDPLVPTGISATATGSVLLLVGASMEGGGAGTHETCGLSGCAEIDAPGDLASESAFYLGGGAVMAAGGATMLVVAIAEPPDHASPGRARAAGGGLGLSIGAGTAVMGAVAMSSGERGVGVGLVGFGAVTSVVSLPFLAWGLGTLDEGEAGDTYTSSGRIVGGSILTTAGLAFGAGSAAIMASASDCSGELCGLGYALGSFPLAASAACLGVGLPLFVGGASIADDKAVPDVNVGAGDLQLRWRFQ